MLERPAWRRIAAGSSARVDARYERQSYELAMCLFRARCSTPPHWRGSPRPSTSDTATYGHDNRGEPVQLVSLRLAAIGVIPPLTIRQQPAPAGTRSAKAAPQVWFRGQARSRHRCYDRARMPSGAVVQDRR